MRWVQRYEMPFSAVNLTATRFEWVRLGDNKSTSLLAPPPWAPSFEHALSVRADALTAPPAAPPRPCVAHRRRLGCRVGALADSFATGARAIYCSARRRCRRSRAHSLARTCAAARRASPCGSVPARAAAPHGSTDCPRSPLVPAPDRLHAADVETETSRRPRRLCSSRPCSSAPACSRSSARSSSALCSWSP